MAAEDIQSSKGSEPAQNQQISIDPVKSHGSSNGEKKSEEYDPYAAYEQKDQEKKTLWGYAKEPGSAIQIIIAALFALAIGLPVAFLVEDVPDAAPTILNIPGRMWLRALTAVGKPSSDQYRSEFSSDRG